MTCGMHEYYMVLHVHIHITSKNGDVCKFCPTERIFHLTWPQLWRHRSNFRGFRVLKFSGGTSKRWAESYRKNGDNRTVNKKDIPEKPQGGASPPPPLCRRGLRSIWFYVNKNGFETSHYVFFSFFVFTLTGYDMCRNYCEAELLRGKVI